SSLRSLKELPVLFVPQKRNQFPQRVSAVAHESNFYGIPKANAFWIKLDLYSFRLTWLRHELDVRERRSYHQQCVAVFQRLLGGLGSKKPDASRGVRAVVWHRSLSEQRLYDWRAQEFSSLFKFFGCIQGAPAGEDRDLFSLVENVGGALKVSMI